MNTKTVILIIIVISAALRIYNIEQKNLWFDEVYSWKISQGSIVDIVSETSGDIHPPFYYLVLKFWMKLFADGIYSMRMLSVLLSLLSIYFIYRLAKLFLEKDYQVMLVLILYAVSPLNIYYSQEVRMLNLNLFLCLGSVYYFLIFSESGSRKSALLYIIFTVLAIYTHYFAFLFLFTELILAAYYYLRKLTLKKNFFIFLICFGIINLFYLPWYPVFITQTSKGQPWRTSQSIIKTGSNILDYFKDVFLSSYYTFESNAVFYFSVFISLLVVTFLIFVLFNILNPKQLTPDKQFKPKKQFSLTLLFFVPFFSSVIISVRQSIVFSRYLSILLPYLFILLVYFSYEYFNKKKSTAFITLLILTSCFGTYINFENNFKNNDYRKIISYLEKNFKQNDEIIAEPHFMGWSLNYYIRHSNTEIKSPQVLGWDLNMQLDSLKRRNDLENIWFILDYSALGKNNYDSLSAIMHNMGYEKFSEKIFYIIPSKVKVEYFIKQAN